LIWIKDSTRAEEDLMQYCIRCDNSRWSARLITSVLSWGALPRIARRPRPVLSATGPIKKIPRTYRRCRRASRPRKTRPIVSQIGNRTRFAREVAVDDEEGGLGCGRPYLAARSDASLRYATACASKLRRSSAFSSSEAMRSKVSACSRYSVSSLIIV
jgi:hypothetical protein